MPKAPEAPNAPPATTPLPPSSFQRVAGFLRFALALLLLYLVLRLLDADTLKQALSRSLKHPGWLLLGVLLTFAGLCAGVQRWHLLLREVGVPLPYATAFRISFIGQFFNAFMPGGCGGDLIRTGLASAQAQQGSRAEAAASVLLDRIIGLFFLLGFSTCMMLARYEHFFGDRSSTRIPAILLSLLLVGGLAAGVIFFRIHIFERWPLFRRLEERFAIGRLLRRAYDCFYRLRKRPWVICAALAGSLLNMAGLTLAVSAFAHALELQISLIDLFTLIPAISVLSSVPLTPGALGVREGLFAGLLGSVGVAPTHAILLSLLAYAGGLVNSLFGGLFLLQGTGQRNASLRELLQGIRDTSTDD